MSTYVVSATLSPPPMTPGVSTPSKIEDIFFHYYCRKEIFKGKGFLLKCYLAGHALGSSLGKGKVPLE